MSNADISPGSALVAELSLSFRDELTASIQGALGVAVEIAVAEVSKLVGQALRDVRDQMHETIRDNKRLESRLHDAENELRVVRGRLAESELQSRATMVIGRVQSLAVHDQEQASAPAADVGPSPERIAECLAEVERKYDAGAPAGAHANGYDGGSFCEIREDGSVCTQDLKPDLTEEEPAAHLEPSAQLEAKSEQLGMKEDHLSIQETFSHFEHAGVEPNDDSEEPADPMEGPVSQDVGTEIAVKVEKPEQCGDPESGSLSEQEEFGSDCLSLAQSRLLEDWRPEALQLQSCQSNSYTSSASNTLADSSIFPGEIPDLDFLTSTSSSQPDPFTAAPAHSEGEPPSLSGQDPQQPYSAHTSATSQHVCKICGQSFARQEDLRRHRTLMHSKQSGHHHKGPKRNLFPPGRSPYHCSQCGRDFNRMEHLKIHQRIHTGERPYVCSVCSACFRHSWALKRHFRIHTGEMPYQCGQCGKTFRNCGGLKFHQRSHARGQVA